MTRSSMALIRRRQLPPCDTQSQRATTPIHHCRRSATTTPSIDNADGHPPARRRGQPLQLPRIDTNMPSRLFFLQFKPIQFTSSHHQYRWPPAPRRPTRTQCCGDQPSPSDGHGTDHYHHRRRPWPPMLCLNETAETTTTPITVDGVKYMGLCCNVCGTYSIYVVRRSQ